MWCGASKVLSCEQWAVGSVRALAAHGSKFLASFLLLAAPAHALELPLYLSPPVQPRLESGRYDCPPPEQPAVRAVWQVLRDYGETDFSCGNAFVSYLETSPLYPSVQPDAFTETADGVRHARSEVLMTNMDFGPESHAPTWLLLDAVADLYAQVKATPAAYPEGMSVRLHLGGYPLPARPPAWVAQMMGAYLLQRGVPLEDQSVGWSVRFAKYDYLPHSHIKMHVIDGQSVIIGGNSWIPTFVALPQGEGVNDLSLQMRGPVAQNAAAAFGDLWAHSQEWICPPEVTAQSLNKCTWRPTQPLQRPASAMAVAQAGRDTALMLYRRRSYLQADEAHFALFRAARHSIDLMQTSLSLPHNCWTEQPWPDICEDMPLPAYYHALLEAMQRGVHVRVLTMDSKLEGLGNKSGVLVLQREAAARGLSQHLEIRAPNYPMHTKAILIDGEAALVGSMNLQFASWGPLGLSEAALLTDAPQAVAAFHHKFEQAWTERSHPFNPYGGPSGDFVAVGEN